VLEQRQEREGGKRSRKREVIGVDEGGGEGTGNRGKAGKRSNLVQ
jgi:hypothetical protein